jgi:hypothetical protein
MQSCGVFKQRQQAGIGLRVGESPVPVAKCIFQSGVENMNANVQESLDGVPTPLHLLLLYHALRNDLVDGRFDNHLKT